MRDFSPPGPGDALGTLINRVRSVIRSIQIGQSIPDVLELLGEPDGVEAGLRSWLPESAEKQLNDFGSRFIHLSRPMAEETFVYVNPYRATMTHCIAFAQGKVVKVWETSGAPRQAT